MQQTQGSIFRLFFKEIDTCHDPQFSEMDVIGSLHKARNIGKQFSEVQP